MKLIRSNLLLLSVLLFCSFGYLNQAKAQNADKISYSIDAGICIPAGPYSFTQNWNTGYGLGAGASYEVQPSVIMSIL